MSADHPVLVSIVAAVSAGVLLIALGRRLGVPAIVLLLAGGVALGPVGIGIVQPEGLGGGMRVIVQLLVGVILFEGGLTLDLAGYRTAAKTIGRILSVGVLVTWVTTALAIHLITGFSLASSFITASLVIVTGPTVIGPLLKRINVTERLHHVLHWEGVLVDPIGVFIALFCFEALALHQGELALMRFGLRIGAGLAIGLVGGFLIYHALRLRLLAEEIAGVSTLACAILIFGVAEQAAHEAGLLAVTVAGFVLGVMRPRSLPQIKHFKGEITELAIGILFILLSARLSLDQFARFGLDGVLVVVIVMFVVRPLSVLASTTGGTWSWQERAFLGWIAPRGIVAASMASLFAIELERFDEARPRFAETFTYSVIIGTIGVSGLTAGLMARVLGVTRKNPRGWIIVGAHGFARAIAKALSSQGVGPIVLIDENRGDVRAAQTQGFDAVVLDPRDPGELATHAYRSALGNLLALSPNEDLNAVVARRWAQVLGAERVFRWRSTQDDSEDRDPGTVVWASLPSPAMLAAELDSGEARIVEAESAPERDRRVRHRLLTVRDKALTMDASAPVVSEPSDGGIAVLLERDASFLGRSLQDEIALEVDQAEIAELLQQMMSAAEERIGPLEGERLVEEMLEREKTLPATLGHGVAVPHAFVAGLDRQRCVFARIRDGVDWGAPDGERVTTVLLLLSPEGENELHLALLADIARLLSAPERRQELLELPLDRAVRTLRRARG